MVAYIIEGNSWNYGDILYWPHTFIGPIHKIYCIYMVVMGFVCRCRNNSYGGGGVHIFVCVCAM